MKSGSTAAQQRQKSGTTPLLCENLLPYADLLVRALGASGFQLQNGAPKPRQDNSSRNVEKYMVKTMYLISLQFGNAIDS